MPTWALIATIGVLTWITLAWLVTRAMRLIGAEAIAESSSAEPVAPTESWSTPIEAPVVPTSFPGLSVEEPIRVLIVDDDPGFRELVSTTFETAHLAVDEAGGASAAAQKIAARHPDVLVLDVGMPCVDGVTFCQGLKADPHTRDIPVVLLTGDAEAELSGWQAGADAFLRKPFSPLELLNVVERFALTRTNGTGPAAPPAPDQSEQLLLYAQDFRHMLELERGQRRLLQTAYRETVVALAQALEAKDGGTSAHSERVRRYATELASVVEPTLLREPGVEYGFILHDVGKIAIPDALLRKTDSLSASERRLLETHPILGEQMVGNAALLRGHGAEVVRSHHERWDGSGYPDGLAGGQIPLAARIFALADALDAMTSDRPYRPAGEWSDAVDEIRREAGSQFDPRVVAAFDEHEEMMRRVYYEVSSN
jgi:response regulator RpfG family c-di-GMP phosphodiesterase